MIKSLGIIGMGHIGTSIALGLREREAVEEIHGYDLDFKSLRQTADRLGGIQPHEHPIALVNKTDLIVLATPPSSIALLCKKLQLRIGEHQIVTDVASIKKPVLDEIEKQCGEIPPWFIPGHPIAGSEKSGPMHADGDMFHDRRVILTLLEHTDRDKSGTVYEMWRKLGAHVARMDANVHDTLFAGISHLPHVAAYALMDVLGTKLRKAHIEYYAGGGLRDTTRIASSDPELWVEICLANRDHLLPILEKYRKRLDDIASALDEEDSDALFHSFSAAKQSRDTLRQKSDD